MLADETKKQVLIDLDSVQRAVFKKIYKNHTAGKKFQILLFDDPSHNWTCFMKGSGEQKHSGFKGGKNASRRRREGLTAAQKIIPLALCNYIVQPDVKRCQKSRGANPVLMNENRWTRQWAVQLPRARLLYGGSAGRQRGGRSARTRRGEPQTDRQTEFLSGKQTFAFQQFDPLH